MERSTITVQNPRIASFAAIVVAISILATGCSEPAWHSWYTNDDYGLSMPMPFGWKVVDDETMLSNERNANEVFLDDDSRPQSELQEAIDRTEYVAILAPTGFNPSSFVPPAVYVLTEAAMEDEKIWDHEEVFRRHCEEEGFSQIGETTSKVFSGGIVLESEFESDSPEIPMFFYLVVFRRGDVFVGIEALGSTAEDRDLLKKIVSDIRID